MSARLPEPHRVRARPFDVASLFTAFYEECPVLKAEPESLRGPAALCALTLSVLSTGLGLLGVPVPDRMWCDRWSVRHITER